MNRYHFAKRSRSKQRRRRSLIAVLLVCLLLFGGYRLAKSQLKANTTIKQAAPVTLHVKPDNEPIKKYNEGSFSVAVPKTWQPLPHLTNPYNLYRWQTSTKETDGKLFSIYEDTIPVNFAVNRVLDVEADGFQLSIDGDVSDNCADFTKANGIVTPEGVRARWQGIDFQCDLSNTARDVIGTSSLGGINSVTLKSPTGQLHRFFFSYADQSMNPNFTPFLSALSSFQLQ